MDTESTDFPAPLERRALRHQIVKRLLEAIILGEFPAGTRLIASKLATRYGVSATPIREALVELEQSGVVELLHHRGAVVKPFGRNDLREYYSVRGLLEGEAARLACGRVDPNILNVQRSEVERLLARSDNDDLEKWVKDLLMVDSRIHLMLVEHCGNRRLVAEIGRYDLVGETLRDLLARSRAEHMDAIVPFVDLLDAMQNHQPRSPAMAAAAIGQHIGIVAQMAESRLFDGNE
jgi:DNA-binding GntR family transcriptional regulator